MEGWKQQVWLQWPEPWFHSHAHVLQQFAARWYNHSGLRLPLHLGMSKSNAAYGRNPWNVFAK